MNRKTFIKTTALAATSASFLNILGAREKGANDRIRFASIGCGKMGNGNMRDMGAYGNVECAAVCDIDTERREKAASLAEKHLGKKPETVSDWRDIISRGDIDAVAISTPDHWHALICVEACKAGKDVYVEKPLANSIAECDAMVEAAQKYRRVVQVGQQRRSGIPWIKMMSYVQSGELGKIFKVNVWANARYAMGRPRVPDCPVPDGIDFDMWLGVAPKVPFNPNKFHSAWRMHWNYGGGLITDLGTHFFDFALWAMNNNSLPKKVSAASVGRSFPELTGETFDNLNVSYDMGDYIMNWSNSLMPVSPYNKYWGIEFCGTNGTLVGDRYGWEIIPAKTRDGKNIIEPLKVLRTDPTDYDKEMMDIEHKAHTDNFLDCVRSRNLDTTCTIQNGALCATYAHLGNIAARSGETLAYDGTAKKFNHSAADKYLKPAYREPWKFPSI